MLTEFDVVTAVCNDLRAACNQVCQQLSETQRGDDIAATRGDTTWLVEAKRETSSKQGTAHHGKPFNRSQVLSHVSRAFYRAAKMRRGDIRAGMALPETPLHLEMVEAIRPSLDELGIVVFWIKAGRTGRVS